MTTCEVVAPGYPVFWTDTPGEDCFEQTVLNELLAEREALTDLQFFMGLCELFCQYSTHQLICTRNCTEYFTITDKFDVQINTEVSVVFSLQQSGSGCTKF